MTSLLCRKCDYCGARVWRWQLAYPHCTVREALERVGLLARFYADSSNAMERMGK